MYIPLLPASIPARSVSQYLPAYTAADYLREGDADRGPDPPRKGMEEWSSLIGIVTAIVGNVLIALALNVQRYAHIRLHREKVRNRERAKQALKSAKNGNGSSQTGYGSVGGPRVGAHAPGSGGDGDGDDGDDANGAHESDPLSQSFQSGDSRWSENSDDDDDDDDDNAAKHSTNYLKSPYWWLGQILITVGEMGNFLAYGFAPASIVSPLGVVALVSNCIIAPIVFKEKFRKRDFWGVVIAVFGAVTVVLSANTQETKLDPHAVWDAIATTEFEVYMGVTCGLIVLLMWLSPRYGHRTILIDLGLVGLFGA
jgi:magnesium transporter